MLPHVEFRTLADQRFLSLFLTAVLRQCSMRSAWRSRFSRHRSMGTLLEVREHSRWKMASLLECSLHGSQELRKERLAVELGQSACNFVGGPKSANRKQIPVCEECHRKIQQGSHNGLKLSSLSISPKMIVVEVKQRNLESLVRGNVHARFSKEAAGNVLK